MAHRIEVGMQAGRVDARGEAVRRSIADDLGIAVDAVRTIDVYTIDGDLAAPEIERLRTGLFTDPVIQVSRADGPLAEAAGGDGFDWLIEVGFRPGVTDNVGRTALAGIRDLLGPAGGAVSGVYTAVQYLLTGALERPDVERIAGGLLANDLIQRWEIVGRDEWASGRRIAVSVPAVRGEADATVREIDLEVEDDALMRISEEGILFLSLAEMKAVRDHFRDEAVRAERARHGLGPRPTDVELEAIAQTWSEHCKHKIFNARIHYFEAGRESVIDSLFDTCIRGATKKVSEKVDWLLSVFHDNAGVIRFDDETSIVMKVETHNSPSALDPYGGALTGIVGVNRDPLGTGMGARLLFNTDVFCFAPPDDPTPLPPRLLHPRRVFRGVHRGVKDGGNESGIPVVNGAILFDTRYRGKPLVFCGTGGILPARVNGRPGHEKRVEPGDLVVMAGGRIGKDGIHGATFSSAELTEESPATAVQIGDPITQKRMVDFLLEARDRGLYRAITDNGAGGLSSSVGEMARMSGGCEIHLDRAPLKYAGLAPWEVLLSEAQERMTLAVPPEQEKALRALAETHDVEVTVLGTFTDSGRFHALHEGRSVALLDMAFFHDGLPRMELRAQWTPPPLEAPEIAPPADLGETLHAILARWNVCSKESWVRQYDHEVQGGSVVKPFTGAKDDGPSDAAVIRPRLDSEAGLAVANGICPRYSDIDTYAMAACALDEAVRGVIAVGGRIGEIAALDNFCWPDPVESEKTPDGQYKLAQLVRACRALYTACVAYHVPLISGKDSMKNDFGTWPEKVSIPPTLLVTAIGRIEDVNRAVTMDAKRAGDLVYGLGVTRREMGGSEYSASLGHVGRRVPVVDLEGSRRVYEALSGAIAARLVASCHDLSDGGLGVALAETAFAGGLGMTVDLRAVPAVGVDRDDEALFSESAGRFVVTVPAERAEAFEAAMAGLPCGRVGAVTAEPVLAVTGLGGAEVIREEITALEASWQAPLDW